MMHTEPFETYNSHFSINGERLFLELFGDGVGRVEKMTIGNRFDIWVTVRPSWCPEKVAMVFDFYKNYAPLLDRNEVQHGWNCYQKAASQRCDSLQSAFWQYMDGKRLKFLDRKKSVFMWV